MKIKNKFYFLAGIAVIIFLAVSYFIKFDIDSGSNYSVQDSLLGIMIFHNPFILAIYILIAIVLIVKGLI